MNCDPISDLLARVRNGYMAGQEILSLPFSRINLGILEILTKEGYLDQVEVSGELPSKQISVTLKYVKGTPALSGIKRLSKPGRRLYSVVKDIPKTLGGYGITILSTNKGLMTDKQAKKSNQGGELICQVW